MFFDESHGWGAHFAVVPIVVNAGAALLPAILAAVTTFLALLFKPRELLRACQARPAIPFAVIAVGLGLWGLIALLPDAAPAAPGGRRAAAGNRPNALGAPVYVDWTRIALARIEAKRNATFSPVSNAVPAAAIVSPASPTAATSPATPTNEPFIFRGGPRRLGALGDGVGPHLKLAWHFYPRYTDSSGVEQEDKEAMILSSPAVHGARVYGASCMLDPPDNFGTVFALDAATGRMLWSIDAINGKELKGFFSSPAVTADGRYLLIGQGLHPDSNCQLICVDTQAGRVHWALPTPLHLESSPAIDGDVVYVGAGAIEDPATRQPISHPGFVLAARISDGTELWRHDVADPESSPVVRDGVLYIGSGFNGNALVALRTAPEAELQQRGETRLLWKAVTPYPITGAVTLQDDLVIAGGGNGDFVYRDPKPAGLVLALERQTGKVRWQTPMPDAVLGAVAAGLLLVCPVANGEVVALKPEDGSRVWATRLSGNAPVLAAAAVAGQDVFAVSQDGYLARLELATGKVIEKVYLNATTKPGELGLTVSSPLVAHGRLLVGSETGGLRAYVGGGP